MTLPARCRALAPAADMDRKAAAIDRQTYGRTDGRTLERYINPAVRAVSVMTMVTTTVMIGTVMRCWPRRCRSWLLLTSPAAAAAADLCVAFVTHWLLVLAITWRCLAATSTAWISSALKSTLQRHTTPDRSVVVIT